MKLDLSAVASAVKNGAFASLLVRPPGLYGAYRRKLQAFDAADETLRKRLQDERLRDVLAGARTLPFYANRPGGAPSSLEDYPALTKDDVRSGAELLVRPTLRRLTVTAQSGGSTGIPVSVRRSLPSIVWEQATIDHTVALGGVDLRTARVAVLRGDSIKDPSDTKAPFWVMRSPTKMVLSAHHLNARNVGEYAGALREYRPDVIMAYPSAVAHLVELLAAASQHLRIPLVVTSSERLPDGLRVRLRDVLGARLIDYYGQAERVSFAWSLEDGVYWFRGDYGVVEFRSRDEETYGALATGLSNTLSPLVRYDTNDMFLIPGRCDAARLSRVALGLEPFSGIAGRTAEFLMTPDGRRIIGLNHIPRGVPGVTSVQLVQDAPDHVLVAVVPGEGFGPESLAVLQANIALKVPDAVRVDIVTREAPVRLASGKAPLFINRIGG